MIGIIHTLLFEYVQDHWGEHIHQQLCQRVGIQQPDFHMNIYYPDTQWKTSLGHAIALCGMSEDDFVWGFGRYSGEALVRMFSGFVHGASSVRDMITRQPRIHNTLASSFSTDERRQISDKFHLEEHPNHTVMHYISPNQLCTFYRSLATWSAEKFHEVIQISEPRCMKRGDAECEIHIRYLGKKDSAPS